MNKKLIAFDLGGHNLRAALIDQKLNILQKKSERTVASRKLSDVIEQIKKLYQGLAKDTKLPISLSIPGYVKKDQTIACAPNFPQWINIKIIDQICQAMDLAIEQCHTLNDANAVMLAEQKLGNAQGINDCLYLGIGTGIGGAIVSDGQLLLGYDSMAGELGHMSIQMDGPLCGCGNRGCIEAYISASALEAKHQKSLKVIADQARKGEEAAQQVYHDLGKHLGVVIASLVNIFNPQRILLGGRVSRSKDLFENTMYEELKIRLKNHPGRDVEIMLAHLGDDAGMIGAAVGYFSKNKG
ncbi:MAG TPA: ROK family protein [Oligoflexia bacterium]|nr:ROK family protein [Oligoflexia bacterium]HMR24933.1 ROK family protein [Oligoflexia bacterium]